MTVPTTGSITATESMLHRVQSEYLEMPGLSLTASQAERLWGVTAEECEGLLARLVARRFLRRTRSGAFVRA